MFQVKAIYQWRKGRSGERGSRVNDEMTSTQLFFFQGSVPVLGPLANIPEVRLHITKVLFEVSELSTLVKNF